jgi:Ca2+-binding RTX toxin-like protein
MSVSLNPTTGLLTAVGTSGRDTITMSVTNGLFKVVDNGKVTTYAASRVKKIHADGKAGFDKITLDPSVRMNATLIGGVGNDLGSELEGDDLTGGSGHDWIVAGNNSGTLSGGAGNDVLDARLQSDGAVFGGNGDDRFINGNAQNYVDAGSGYDTADYSYSVSDVVLGNASTLLAKGYPNGGAGSATEQDTLVAFEHFTGGKGNDRLHGDAANNTLRGGAGADLLYGNAGNDTLEGGTGRDALYGETGNDLLLGRGDGSADFLSGGYGTDTAKKDSADTTIGIEVLA